MIKTLSISQLRRELPQVLKELQKHPELIYQISVNRVIVGELVAPRKLDKKGKATKVRVYRPVGRAVNSYP